MFLTPGWVLRHRIRVFLHSVRFPGQPMFSARAAGPLIGRRIIVGVTHVDQAGRLVRREQFHGRIVRASVREGLVIQTPSGEERRLPPDLRAFFGARPGEYRLRSSGEVVRDPDLQTSWTVTMPARNSSDRDRSSSVQPRIESESLDTMAGIEIRDRRARGGLAFDLKEILHCLGGEATDRVWRCAHLSVTGEAAPALAAAEESGTRLGGQELLLLAERITQTIDGEFMGRRPDEEFDSLRIHAIDSSFWEVFGDQRCLNRLRSAFGDVRPSRVKHQ